MTQFMDLPATKRATLGRQWDQQWRDRYPERAAYLDDHPPGPAQPCDICGYHAKRGEQRTKRRWDWDTKPEPTFVWRCNGCFKQHGRTPKQELTTPPPVFDAQTKRRLAAASLPTDQNPNYYIEGGHAYLIGEADRERLTRMQAAAEQDDDDQPARPGSKLDDWFFPRDKDE